MRYLILVIFIVFFPKTSHGETFSNVQDSQYYIKLIEESLDIPQSLTPDLSSLKTYSDIEKVFIKSATGKNIIFDYWGYIVSPKYTKIIDSIFEDCYLKFLITHSIKHSKEWPVVNLTVVYEGSDGRIKKYFLFYTSLIQEKYNNENTFCIDDSFRGKRILYRYPDLIDSQAPVWDWGKSLATYWAWEPFGRWWELKEEELTKVKAYNDQKIETFLKGLEKTWENPKYDYLFKEKKLIYPRAASRLVYKPEELEKLWKKFSDNWDKKNPDKVPKVKAIPL